MLGLELHVDLIKASIASFPRWILGISSCVKAANLERHLSRIFRRRALVENAHDSGWAMRFFVYSKCSSNLNQCYARLVFIAVEKNI